MHTAKQAADLILACPVPTDCEVRDISDDFGLDDRFIVYGLYTDTGVRAAYVTLYSNDSADLVMATVRISLSCHISHTQLGLDWVNSCLNKLYPRLKGTLLNKLTEDCPWNVDSLSALSTGTPITNELSNDSQTLVYDALGGYYASLQLWLMEE